MSGGHYFDSDPAVASRPDVVRLSLPDVSIELATDRGVFSRLGVDRGTELLLREAPAPPVEGDILDLGCGYGPMAVVMARRSPAARVWAVDINNRALELVRANALRAGAPNVTAARPDEVPPDLRFAALYSNPPVRIGKEPLRNLPTTWVDRLQPEGSAVVVVHRHLGSDSLARWLRERGHAVERLRSRTGYRLLRILPLPAR
ncbi:MAG: class I SAM-dependent methyltransferase [Candidatus Dormibacteria bacterium]